MARPNHFRLTLTFLLTSGLGVGNVVDMDDTLIRKGRLMDMGARLDVDFDAPMPYAFWLDDEILGAGNTIEDAVNDAYRQLEEWERSK